jgi:hypothetical protein
MVQESYCAIYCLGMIGRFTGNKMLSTVNSESVPAISALKDCELNEFQVNPSPNLGVAFPTLWIMPIPRNIFEQLKQLIPPLDGSLHKGQSGEPLESITQNMIRMPRVGRVGVLGGALE